MALHLVQLAHETDFNAWRNAARQLLTTHTPPAAVTWQVGNAMSGLFEDALTTILNGTETGKVPKGNFTVPSQFMELCQSAILHRDPSRFGLLYKLLWRLQREPQLMRMAFDSDVIQLTKMAQAVRRDMHKMKAFVRFREIEMDGRAHFIAWFEPDHYVVEALAPFFTGRFTTMHWSILSPYTSMHWDSSQLSFSKGGRREDVPKEDAGEELWCSYYSHIFNPARLKVKAMQAEMPKKYWRNLPEANLIAGLIANANKRTEQMMSAEPQLPNRKILKYAAAKKVIERDGISLTHGIEVPSELNRGDDMHQQQAMQALNDEMRAYGDFPLAKQATQIVLGEGPTPASIMLVGEQPGDLEDIAGRPFVGPAGKLLDKALLKAGINREQSYLTNTVKHFEFRQENGRRKNITPTGAHISAYRPWLQREVEIVQPRVIVALGAIATQGLLGEKLPILKNRGQFFDYAGNATGKQAVGIKVLITVHPSSILRTPDRAAREVAYANFVADLVIAAQEANK